MKLIDMWTKFLWRLSYGDKPCPDYMLSDYEEKQPPKLSPEETLVRLVIMDIEMYPSQWKAMKAADNRKGIENESAGIKVTKCDLPMIRGEGTRVNGIVVDKPGQKCVNWNEIVNTFNRRNMHSVLEKLLDRVERIETVEYTEVQEAKRLELVDPFAKEPKQILLEHIVGMETKINELKAKGISSMKPKPIATKSIAPIKRSSNISVLKPSRIQMATALTRRATEERNRGKHVTLWRGRPIDRLSMEQAEECYKFLHGYEREYR